MKKKLSFNFCHWSPIAYCLLPILLIGCAGYTSSPQILPPNIKKIAIPTFENKTIYYGLEEKFTLRVIEEFLRDGRLEITDEEDADAIIKGTITRYVLEPLTYTANFVVDEYKLWIIFDLALYEKDEVTTSKGEPLWEEKNLEGIYRFFVSTSTEEEAREMLWDTLARDILRRTIYGFGTVTGASERRIPQ